MFEPVHAPDGQITGVFMMGYDVSEHVWAKDRQKLLVDELNHRVTNTLAVVQALTRLTGKTAAGVDDYMASLDSRIQAMANTHDMLTATLWQPVNLRRLLDLELAPYAEGPVTLACEPDLTIAAKDAVSLSLIVHELLTNAAKYGGLAGPGGRLEVQCAPDGLGRAQLIWHETTESAEAPDTSSGFGGRLIQRLARDLKGEAHLDFQPDGLKARLTFAVVP